MITCYRRFSCKLQIGKKELVNQFLLLYTTQMDLKNLVTMKCKIETSNSENYIKKYQYSIKGGTCNVQYIYLVMVQNFMVMVY